LTTLDGKMVDLSARELSLLEVLLQRARRPLSKDQLVERLCEWGEEVSLKRALSLFHVVVPVVLIWMLHELGYDSRAPVAQTLLAWFVLPITYAVTTSSDENINWVRGPGKLQRRVHPLVWLGFLMLAFPIGLYLPMHFVLQALFAQAG
jgi:hypothetical protein